MGPCSHTPLKAAHTQCAEVEEQIAEFGKTSMERVFIGHEIGEGAQVLLFCLRPGPEAFIATM